jgi:hypothetical protein
LSVAIVSEGKASGATKRAQVQSIQARVPDHGVIGRTVAGKGPTGDLGKCFGERVEVYCIRRRVRACTSQLGTLFVSVGFATTLRTGAPRPTTKEWIG